MVQRSAVYCSLYLYCIYGNDKKNIIPNFFKTKFFGFLTPKSRDFGGVGAQITQPLFYTNKNLKYNIYFANINKIILFYIDCYTFEV